jgi:phospholipid/cholesterol/gamma-HCH transport system substrate-binding protein
MNKKSIEVMVGLFVLLGIAALLFLALKAANLASFGQHEGYVVRARFDNIGGLKPRAPVRSAGVTVGRVRSISLDPKTYQGVVRLEIDNHVKFPTDTSAKILTAGLLGDQYIGLEPGYAEKELVAGDTTNPTPPAAVLEKPIGQLIFNRAADAGTDAPAPPAPSASAVKKQP